MHTELVLRFGYGAVGPVGPRVDTGALRAIAGPTWSCCIRPCTFAEST